MSNGSTSEIQPTLFDSSDEDDKPTPARAIIKPITRRLVNTRLDILDESPDQVDFLHTVFCQLGMPRSQTDARECERRNGRMLLHLEAGGLVVRGKYVKQPLPYGARARLIMVHVSNMAVRHQSPVVDVGHSAYEFLKSLGFDTNGDSYKKTRQQIMALAACRLTLGMSQGGLDVTINTQPIERFEAWLQREDNGQRVMWPGKIELSQKFYETLLEHAVPLDPRSKPCANLPSPLMSTPGWRIVSAVCVRSKAPNSTGPICASSLARNTTIDGTSNASSVSPCRKPSPCIPMLKSKP